MVINTIIKFFDVSIWIFTLYVSMVRYNKIKRAGCGEIELRIGLSTGIGFIPASMPVEIGGCYD